jgi:hypothetical protein
MGDQSSLPQAVEDAPFPLTEVDKWVLSQTDEEFKMHDWEDLRHIIGECAFTLSLVVFKGNDTSDLLITKAHDMSFSRDK